MKKKFIFKAFGLLLATAVMVTSVRSEVLTVGANPTEEIMEGTTEEVSEETTKATLSGNSVADIMSFDWKEASDEVVNAVLNRTDWADIGDWLSYMTEEELQELLKRDTLLKEQMVVYDYELDETSEETTETSGLYRKTGSMETTFYEYALSQKTPPTGSMTRALAKRTFAHNQGSYSIECVFPNKTYTYTIRLTGVDTDKSISLQQKKLSLAVIGGGWTGLTMLDDNSVNLRLDFGINPDDPNVIPYYVYLYENWQLVKPAGYNVTKSSKGYSGNFSLFIKSKNANNYEFDVSTGKCTYWNGDESEYGAATYKLVTHSNIIRDLGFSDSNGATTINGVHRLTFTPAVYNVNYHGNGATSGSVAAQNCRYGTTYTTQNNGFTRAYTITYNGNGGTPAIPNQVAGYTFKGWGMNTTAGVNYAGGQSYSNLTTVNGGKVNMYAIWSPVSVKPPVAFRTGYQFAGWNINGIKVGAGAAYTPTSDVTAVAQWKPNNYQIQLDACGGTEFDDIAATYDKEVSLPVPSRAGYTFNGWVGEGGTFKGTVKNLTAVNEATVKLTADWTANTDTKYVVQYWKQPDESVTDFSRYELFDKKKGDAIEGVKILSGVTDFTIVIPPVAVKGYDTPEAKLATIKGDGSTVVNFYYNRAKAGPDSGDIVSGTGMTQTQIDEIAKRLAAGLSFSLKLDGATYEIMQNDDGSLGIKFISTSEPRLVIPDVVTIGDKVYRITEIYEKAFKDNTSIQEVEVSANISKVGNSAFEGCTSLKKITLHEGLVTIGEKAFYNCSSLTELKTPASLQIIENNAFRNCTSLNKVTLNGGLIKMGSYIFYNCGNLKKIKIPKSVLKIGGYAFGKCIKLKTVSYEEGSQLLTMGTGVFYGCKVLSKISLPDKLTNVAGKCFYGCKAMKKVTLGKSVTTISDNAFRNCKSFTKITIPSKVQTIGKNAFYNCKNLNKVTIKSKALTQVGSKAFKQCKKSIKFVVPKSKKSAYQKLFQGKY